MEHEIPFGTFCPEKQDYLFRRSVAPGTFPLEWPEKVCTIYFPTGISVKVFVNGKQPKTHWIFARLYWKGQSAWEPMRVRSLCKPFVPIVTIEEEWRYKYSTAQWEPTPIPQHVNLFTYESFTYPFYLSTLHIKGLLSLNTIALGFSNDVTSLPRPYLDLLSTCLFADPIPRTTFRVPPQ